VAERTGLDDRTIRKILRGRNRPHARTLHRLAEGLGVSADELFVEPSQLLYRRFDRETNPLVAEVVQSQPALFHGWTEADFDELHSRFGAGGPLTREGALTAAAQMNRKRDLLRKLALLMETGHAELIGRIVDAMHDEIVAQGDQNLACLAVTVGSMSKGTAERTLPSM
jgi:transcriptional regulator with XRE-family HTH domain